MILLTSLREVNKIAGYRGLRASAFSLPWRAAIDKLNTFIKIQLFGSKHEITHRVC